LSAAVTSISASKQPYGSGDSEDGYTLVFANLDEFQTWRLTEEERNCVEFVKVRVLIAYEMFMDKPSFREIRMAAKQTLLVSKSIPN